MKFLLSQSETSQPALLIKKFCELYSKRLVLDVGTGSGRNAIYLAQQGFMVTAIDREEESVAELQEFLKTNPLPMVAKVLDLKTETPIFSKYDAVIFFNILHYFKYQRGQFLLQRAVGEAKAGDVHIMSAMTTVGDFYKINPNSYYLKPNELKNFYEQSGWKVVVYLEKEIIARAKHKDGTPMQNVVSLVITEKL